MQAFSASQRNFSSVVETCMQGRDEESLTAHDLQTLSSQEVFSTISKLE